MTYSQALAEAGGTAPFTYTLTSGSLPAGLTLNASTSVISGTPITAVSAQAFTVKVTDSAPIPQSISAFGKMFVCNARRFNWLSRSQLYR